MTRAGTRRPRRRCSGPLPAGYAHGERRTYLRGFCRGRECADAALDYSRDRYAARRGGVVGPTGKLGEVEADARSRACPACHALPGERCVTGGGRRAARAHLSRREPGAPVRYDLATYRRGTGDAPQP